MTDLQHLLRNSVKRINTIEKDMNPDLSLEETITSAMGDLLSVRVSNSDNPMIRKINNSISQLSKKIETRKRLLKKLEQRKSLRNC
jgi:hypothetical protein